MFKRRLPLINSILFLSIVVINGYVILGPLIPAIQFWYRDNFSIDKRAQLQKTVEPSPVNAKEPAYTGPNKIVIPDLLMDEQIYEGASLRTANKGIWRLPSSSSPDKGGNTVLVGHRFIYSRKPAVFYSLDKVKVGDKLAVFWDQKKYVYQVDEVKVVNPKEIDVEKQTDDPRLTIYTCTPLWTSKNRLVVIARQLEGQ